MDEDKLPTVDLSGLEIFSSGTFNGDTYSDADLDAMVTAFDKVGFKPTVKAGHADGQEDEKAARKVFGAPSLGYVSRIYRTGKKLLADATQVPRRFADLIKAGSYKRISSEIYWNFCADDKAEKHPRVLKSIAFLGADIPALTSLKEIEALYQKNEAGGLFAYDDNKREFHIYTAEVVDPPLTVNRYVDPHQYEGFTVKEEDNQFCVYGVEGKIKCWSTREEADNSIKGYATDSNKDTSHKEYAMKIKEEDGKYCVYDGDKKLKSFPSKEDAQAYMDDMKEEDYKLKGETHMTDKELEAARAAMQKEFDDKLESIKTDFASKLESSKTETEKATAEKYEQRVHKLESERRTISIDSWIKDQKQAGKLAPVQESAMRAILFALPDEGEKVVTYSREDKTEVKQSLAEAIKEFVTTQPSIFKTLSQHTDSDESTGEYNNASAEVDRRTREYMQKNSEKDYRTAMTYVLKTDEVLKQKWEDNKN